MKRGQISKKGQIWVETIIYTLIAVSMIAAVLFFVQPKIKELQDKTIISQSIEVMRYIDSIIAEVGQGVPGNKREFEVGIKKGTLTFDGKDDKIIFKIKSNYEYSEPEIAINEGDLEILTTKKGEDITVTLTVNYTQYDLKYKGEDEVKILPAASTPYRVLISNEGSAPLKINIEIA